MTTQNTETLVNRAYGLAEELSAVNDFLYAVAGEPPVLYREEVEAAHRVHRQICESLNLARRIHLWLAFRPQAMMVWNGTGLDEIDTSAYTVDWAAKSLGSIEHFLNRKDLKTIRTAVFRLHAAISSSQMGRRTA
jgi:hypothetical protein